MYLNNNKVNVFSFKYVYLVVWIFPGASNCWILLADSSIFSYSLVWMPSINFLLNMIILLCFNRYSDKEN